jgi:malate dehydrogenase (oxaloacetate-decarboxylating)(NADP+)
VLTWVAPAVAQAAMETGVARMPIEDFDAYRTQLNIRMGRTQPIIAHMYAKASQQPQRIVLPEGDQHRVIKAAQLAVDEGIAQSRSCWAWKKRSAPSPRSTASISTASRSSIPKTHPRTEEYMREYYRLRRA